MDNRIRMRIVELAMRAPNVDNSQPFHFCWDGDRLLIHRDPKRDRQRGGAGGYVTMLGLGCLIEYATIAATDHGLKADASIAREPRRPREPWAAVSFEPADLAPDPLLPGLALRTSDRRLYQGGSLSDRVFREVAADVARDARVTLHFEGHAGGDLLAHLRSCEAFLWADDRILPEMLSWVRWNRRQVDRTRDGMPWQAMAVPYPVSRLMRLVARSSRFRRFARRTGGPLRAQQKAVEAQVRSSAALGCFAVEDTQPERMLQVGRAFVRAWVRLNMAGYGVQVMASPSLHVLQHAADVLPEDYPDTSKKVFAGGREVLSTAFGIDADRIPAWMFRTGRSPALPDKMRTLRRPVAEVVSRSG